MYIGNDEYELHHRGDKIIVTKEEVIEMLMDISGVNQGGNYYNEVIGTASTDEIKSNPHIRRILTREQGEETIEEFVEDIVDNVLDIAVEEAEEYYDDNFIIFERTT